MASADEPTAGATGLAPAQIIELVQSMRQQLHTPLNHIVGLSEIMLDDAEEKGRTALLDGLGRIREAGSTLTRLINEAFDMERLEIGGLDPAAISRELRTTLYAAIGYSQMLQEDAQAEGWLELVPDLQRIEQASNELTGFIQPILDLAAVANGPDAHARLREQQPQLAWTPLPVCAPEHAGHLLVVDHNETDREMLARRLLRLGHTVDAVGDGFAALDQLAKDAYDLVLCDVLLPEMNGYDLISQIKTSEALRDIPVIVVSTIDGSDWVARCIEVGAEDFLPKPYDPALLRARLDACLEKRRLRTKEIQYLHAAQQVAAAAEALEAATFHAESLDGVAARNDSLGHLARVFQRMAREVAAREQRLRDEVQQLRIVIDTKEAEREVADITETDFFRELKAKTRKLRGDLEPQNTPEPSA
jgi:CheY-like chemotaxis protein